MHKYYIGDIQNHLTLQLFNSIILVLFQKGFYRKNLKDRKEVGQSKWRMPLIVAVLAVVIIGSIWLNVAPFRSGFEITDELGGNIFPSSILSVATTDAQVIVPADSMFVGNPKSCIAVKSGYHTSRVISLNKSTYRRRERERSRTGVKIKYSRDSFTARGEPKRLWFPHNHRISRHNHLGICRCNRQNAGRKNIPTQFIRYLKTGTERSNVQPNRTNNYNSQYSHY